MTVANNFEIIPIQKTHLKTLTDFPFIHRDPFDRLLIATAVSENLSFLTADEDIKKYDIPFIW